MLYRHVFDKISTEFRGILHVFVNFAALRRRKISEALTMSCVISITQTGDLRIFLISSPEQIKLLKVFVQTLRGSFFKRSCELFFYLKSVCKKDY